MAAEASAPGVVAAFGGGLLSFASPCVLPLVPGYLSLMSGVSLADLEQGGAGHVGRVVRSTLLFIAGFTVVFVALGATASALGQALLDRRRVLETVAGIVVIGMGIVLAGFASPRVVMTERRFHVSPSRLGPWAAPVMGMAFAFGWTPCIGLILGGVLALAASEATLTRGVILLVAYSLGLGVPFLVAGVALGRLTGVLAWFRRHAGVINLVSGVVLAAFGFLLVIHRVGWLATRMIQAMRAAHLEFLTRI